MPYGLRKVNRKGEKIRGKRRRALEKACGL